jgi:hypothetical protein
MAMPSTLIFARFVLEPSRRGRIFFLGSNANSGSPAAGADAAAGSSSAALATTERARSSSPMRRIDLAAGRPPATDGALATVILFAPTATRPTDLTGTAAVLPITANMAPHVLSSLHRRPDDAHFPLLRDGSFAS